MHLQKEGPYYKVMQFEQSDINIMEMFIEASANIIDVHSREWQHYANLSKEELRSRWETPTGKGIKQHLLNGRLSRTALEQQVGKFDGKFDLRGITIESADLSRLDLRDIDFFAANLAQSNMSASNLTGSFLSECDLRGANLEWAKLDGVLLDNVVFDSKTNLLGVNLNAVNFTYATLLYDLALTQQRIQQLNHHAPIFAGFLRISCDYGRSFSRYMAWVVAFIVSYAGLYWLFPSFLNAVPTTRSLIDCLYFSMVTFATVGYGDITPVSIAGRLIVMSEIAVGYIMGGLLVAILAKRVIG